MRRALLAAACLSGSVLVLTASFSATRMVLALRAQPTTLPWVTYVPDARAIVIDEGAPNDTTLCLHTECAPLGQWQRRTDVLSVIGVPPVTTPGLRTQTLLARR